MTHALVVEDDRDAAEMIAAVIAAEGLSVATAGSLKEARRQIALQAPALVLLDLQLPDGSGMRLFDNLAEAGDTEIVLITGHASLATSIEALRLGAADYLVKPIGHEQLLAILARMKPPAELKADIAQMGADWQSSGRFGQLWGRSEAMQHVYQQVARVAGTAVSVFVTGESGTGKELVARAVHDLSRRRNEEFLAVNCGAISPNLIESELFGHEKGSFTGADRQHHGFFARAHGGTLFLDEITEMPLELQVKLLRVLETGRFMRVGSTQSQVADVRIVAATNRSPAEAVSRGRLREDLLYRLNVFPIELPPLRDRGEDVVLLAHHFLAGLCEGEPRRVGLSSAAIAKLMAHHWPGNVRELRNVMQRAFVMTDGDTIGDRWLPMSAVSPPDDGSSSRAHGDARAVLIPLGMPMAEVERTLIEATLKHCNNHRELTAAMLGVSLKTLYNRLKSYSREGATVDLPA